WTQDQIRGPFSCDGHQTLSSCARAQSRTRRKDLALLGDAPDLLRTLRRGAHDRSLVGLEKAPVAHYGLAVDHDERDVAGVALPDDILDRVPHRLKAGLEEVKHEAVGLCAGRGAAEVREAPGVGAVQRTGADEFVRAAEVALAEVLLREQAGG